MVVVEVAGDVIGSDRREPAISLSFNDRVMSALKPQEPRVVRIIRLRRVAAVLGPILSAAAVWMFVASAIRPIELVQSPAGLATVQTPEVPTPRTAAAIEVAQSPGSPVTIVDALAEGLLTPAVTAWQNTQQSTRDLAALGRLVFGTAGQNLGNPLEEGTDGGEGSVLLNAGAVLRNMLAPKTKGQTPDEGPDVL